MNIIIPRNPSAKLWGKNRSYVANSLRLLSLDEKKKRTVWNRAPLHQYGRALLSVKTAEGRVFLLDEGDYETGGLSVRQAEEMAKRINSVGSGDTKPAPKKTAHTFPLISGRWKISCVNNSAPR